MQIIIMTDCDKCGHLNVCRYLGGPDALRDDLIDLIAKANKNMDYTNYTVSIACPHYRSCKDERG